MSKNQGYKKYMKKNTTKDYSLFKLFIISFFGMLLVFTFLITTLSPNVDTSIGGDKPEEGNDAGNLFKENIDSRLAMIKEEDQGRSFSDIMNTADRREKAEANANLEFSDLKNEINTPVKTQEANPEPVKQQEVVYKVFIGTYTTAEQAKVAKDIITESGSNLNPIVKCIGSNDYTLQVGIFKNKASADALLQTIQANHLPARIETN
ncbi:MAG: SPOR domain-containing protein [bacterium]|nr:SPOR domain-containing protein [bacterium]